MAKAKEIFSKNLGLLLEASKVSKRAFCQAIGISRTALDAFLNMETDPVLSSIEKTAEYFGISTHEMLSPELRVEIRMEVSVVENEGGKKEELARKLAALNESEAADILDLIRLKEEAHGELEAEGSEGQDKKRKHF